MKLIVKQLTETAQIPTYGDEFAAGLDIRSAKDYIIEPKQRECISTGIAIEWIKNNENDENPENFYMRIAARSGLSVKNNIDLGAGVIDSNYRGEIKVVLINNGTEKFIINTGDRIAQGILTRIIRFDEIVLQTDLSETIRGEGGFGSTGIK
jgi:dUTP pyrophosphatase